MERAKRSTCFVDFSLKKKSQRKKKRSSVKSKKGRKKETNFLAKCVKLTPSEVAAICLQSPSATWVGVAKRGQRAPLRWAGL